MAWDGAHLETFPAKEAVVFEICQFLLSLAVVFIATSVVKSLGETFHGRHTYTQSFTAVAYALSPLFTLRLLDAFSAVPPWLTWAIGIVLSLVCSITVCRGPCCRTRRRHLDFI